MGIITAACLLALGAAATAAEKNPLESLRTPAEKLNWERTTSSQEVIDYATEVAKYSNGRVRLEFITWTAQGKLVPLFVMGLPAPKSPEQVAKDKVVAFVNCNIHSGEVEGKESMLIFAREVALGKHDDLLKDVIIVLCPNMSPDGNDNLGTWRRGSQFTPAVVGTRYNAQGFNMNRDMTKLEAYEARALVEVMNKWDPVIFIDAHATNGSYMRHAVTYNWGLHPNTDEDLMKYNRGEFAKKAIGSESYLFKTLGHTSIPYGNFGENYSGKVSEGWWTFEDYPRYTTNYAGLRNRLAMLLEVYSYDDFKTRVDTQYACIYGILQAVAADKTHIKELIAQADARSAARKTTGISSKDVVCLNSKLAVLDDIDGGMVSVDSYIATDDRVVPKSIDYDEEGFKKKLYFEGPATYYIPYYGKFVPVATEQMGAYYVLREGADDAVTLLLRHGIEVSQLTEDVHVDNFKWYRIDETNRKESLYEGHYMNVMSGDWLVSSDLTLPKGSYVVSTAQKNGSLAALLLEPESVDGLVSWNYLDKLITTEGSRVDRFNNKNKVFPEWKLDDFALISDKQLKPVDKIAYDKELPDPIEPINPTPVPYDDDDDSSGCNAGFASIGGLAALLLSLKLFRKKK